MCFVAALQGFCLYVSADDLSHVDNLQYIHLCLCFTEYFAIAVTILPVPCKQACYCTCYPLNYDMSGYGYLTGMSMNSVTLVWVPCALLPHCKGFVCMSARMIFPTWTTSSIYTYACASLSILQLP